VARKIILESYHRPVMAFVVLVMPHRSDGASVASQSFHRPIMLIRLFLDKLAAEH
jgi:hypothetical protein